MASPLKNNSLDRSLVAKQTLAPYQLPGLLSGTKNSSDARAPRRKNNRVKSLLPQSGLENSKNNDLSQYNPPSKRQFVNAEQYDSSLMQRNKFHSVRLNQQPHSGNNLSSVEKSMGQQCQVDNPQFTHTKHKLLTTNFNHHDPVKCVCNYCNCGRHLCKLHVIKPDLTLGTTYKGHYSRKSPIQGPCARPRSSKRPNSDASLLQTGTVYGQDFKSKTIDVQRPHPQDTLDMTGPPCYLTTYGTTHVGVKGHKNLPFLNGHSTVSPPGLPFTHQESTYKSMYSPLPLDNNRTPRGADHLRAGGMWMGHTTYRDLFKEPHDNYTVPERKLRNQDSQPNFTHQFGIQSSPYQTVYKNDFLGPNPVVCPAKVQLETRVRGFFSGSKTNFRENSDFKSMSPDFKAISTSKHSYV